jgi:hypothetical protein
VAHPISLLGEPSYPNNRQTVTLQISFHCEKEGLARVVHDELPHDMHLKEVCIYVLYWYVRVGSGSTILGSRMNIV